MTQAQAQAAIKTRFVAGLVGSPYSAARVTDSMEDATSAYEQKTAWVLVTLQRHAPNRWQAEDEWTFMVQASVSLQPGAQATTTAANDADITFCALLSDSINSDAGYTALRNAGVLQAEMDTMPEDQQSEATINPHALTCSTY